MRTTTLWGFRPLRWALLLPLLLLSVLAQAQNNGESLYGTLSYQTRGASNLDVRFRFVFSYILDIAHPPAVGSVYGLGTTIVFGDGTQAAFPATVIVATGLSVTLEVIGTHTYAAPGTYLAGAGLSPTSSNLENTPPRQTLHLQTLVVAGSPTNSPVASTTPSDALDLMGGRVATYQVHVNNPDGNALTYSLATAADLANQNFTNPSGLSVDPQTGLVSFNTTGQLATVPLADVRYYDAAIKVSDGKTSIVVYNVLRVRLPYATTPAFVAPTRPDGQRIQAQAGSTLSFIVKASAPDPAEKLTLTSANLPAGATLVPVFSVSTNVAEARFSWTPVRGTDGIFPVTFTATNSKGETVSTSVRIELQGFLPPVFVAPTPADKQVFTLVPGQPLSFTVKALTPGLLNEGTYLFLDSPLPPGAMLSAALPLSANSPTPVQTTFTWTPKLTDLGTYQLLFQATSYTDAQTFTGVTIVVKPEACDPAATQPVAATDQLTTSGRPVSFTAAQLLTNDVSPLGLPLRATILGLPKRGRLTSSGDTSFTYTPYGTYTGPDTLTYLVQPAGPVLASPVTGHYYEFVSAPGLCWEQARTAAAARTYQGMTGYLATITSEAEKTFLAGRQPGRYWLGASDAEVEGEWRWKTGPEAGQLFWQGAANGQAVGYSNWNAGEPNDFKNQYRPQGEDYAEFYGQSGLWNDLDNCGTGARLAGYLVEYGGLESCTPVLYATGRVVISIGGSALARTANPASAPLAAATDAATALSVYPNPSSGGQFRVQLAARLDGPARLDLLDLQGRRVSTLFEGRLQAGEVREVAVNLPELASGLYLLRLQNGGLVNTQRVSVQP